MHAGIGDSIVSKITLSYRNLFFHVQMIPTIHLHSLVLATIAVAHDNSSARAEFPGRLGQSK